MTQRAFQILLAMQYDGFEEGAFDFVEDIESTSEYFGTVTDEALLGHWLAVWRDDDEESIGTYTIDSKPIRADKKKLLKDSSECILLFNLDN